MHSDDTSASPPQPDSTPGRSIPVRSKPALKQGDLLPHIRVRPPGPRARDLLAKLEATEAPLLAGLPDDDFADSLAPWAAARGANVADVDGNVYIDWTSGFGVAFTGHAPSEVVEAFTDQASTLLHGLGDVTGHHLRAELARQLSEIAPVEDGRVYWAISGSDAVDLALKAAFLATGRAGVLAFEPCYHGLGLGALGATSRPEFRRPFEPLLRKDRFNHLPYGAPRTELRRALRAEPRPGAVIFEPIVGREGVRTPPEGWVRALAEEARDAGVLVVADEILTGGGRTGDWFAVDLDGVRPDLLCCGKVLSGGTPLAFVLGRNEIFASFANGHEAMHTSTFLAHPPACAAALANLKRIRQLGLLDRAKDLGEQLCDWAQAELPPSVKLCGRGALQGLRFPNAVAAEAFTRRVVRRGFLVLSNKSCVQLMPPVTLSQEQLRASLEAFAEVARVDSD